MGAVIVLIEKVVAVLVLLVFNYPLHDETKTLRIIIRTYYDKKLKVTIPGLSPFKRYDFQKLSLCNLNAAAN